MLLRAGTWRAARSGLDGDLIDPVGSRPMPAAAAVEALLAYLRPALERFGDWDTAAELTGVLMRRGTSAQRQRTLLEESASDADIVRSVVAETASA